MDFVDPRWEGLQGGYRVAYDPRPALLRLERGDRSAWGDLWDNLHHQGDVGEASYAALVALVRTHTEQNQREENFYSLAACIEECRTKGANPALSDWLKASYDEAWQRLASMAVGDFQSASKPEIVDGILSVMAFYKGRRVLGEIASPNYTEEERSQMLRAYFEE